MQYRSPPCAYRRSRAVLRRSQHEDTLITILETFVHDPTADFLGGRKRKKINGVPDTPQEVLDMVRTKVNGYLKGESVPLSVEGYTDALIAMAKDPFNLASMYNRGGVRFSSFALKE